MRCSSGVFGSSVFLGSHSELLEGLLAGHVSLDRHGHPLAHLPDEVGVAVDGQHLAALPGQGKGN